jgi:hypothetical protein
MSDLKNPEGIDIFVDERTGVETAVIGLLERKEFAWAQTVLSDLNHYADYEDWVDSRESLQFGLVIAGVDARIAAVDLRRVLMWCRLSDVLPSERSLNAFAAMSSRFRDASAAFAYVRRDDFVRRLGVAAPFDKHGDYEAWMRHRALARQKAPRRVVELPVHVGDFLAWCQCVGESVSEVALDRYATLVLEFLIQDIQL